MDEFENDDNRAVAASGVSLADDETLIILRVNPASKGVVVTIEE